MPPEATPTAVLRARLSASLEVRTPSARLREAPAEELSRYAHDLTYRESGPEAQKLCVDGWVAETGGDNRAIRRYLVAQVRIHEAGSWFPELLATASRWRSHLASDEQADLVIVLVASGDAPPGQVEVLERNEAFAQVHVWDPGIDPAHWSPKADRFVSRLRVGPIAGPHGEVGGDLSPVDEIFQGISRDLRERWSKVLMDHKIKDAERAKQLLRAAEEPSGGADVR